MILRNLLFSIALAAALGAVGCGETTYEFDPVSVGDDGDSGRAPRAKTNQQFLRSVYADLIGRAPEVYDVVIALGNQELGTFRLDEQTFLLGGLDAVGDPAPMRSLIASGLVRHEEAGVLDKEEVGDPDDFIRNQFRRFLGRDPNTYELQGFRDAWDNDEAVNPRTVIRALVDSREYQSL